MNPALPFVNQVPTTLRVLKRLMQWWSQRKAASRGFALVMVCAVLGINAFYLPVHVMSEHRDHDFVAAHGDEAHHLDQACEDGCPDHNGSDHDLLSLQPLALGIGPFAVSDCVAYVLPIPHLVVQLVDDHWCPKSTDRDRAPPGPSRAPPL